MQQVAEVPITALLAITTTLVAAISIVFWRLWDASNAHVRRAQEAEQAARKQAIDSLERWVIGEANTAREYHDKDAEGIRAVIASQGREIGEAKRDIVDLKRDTGNHRTEIALLTQLLTRIETGVDEIKASLKEQRK